MILVKNTFKFYNHLFKSKTSIYVFGYNNIIIGNTFEKFQLNYYPKEIVKISAPGTQKVGAPKGAAAAKGGMLSCG